MDRRSFLRATGLVAGGAAVGAVVVDALHSGGAPAATGAGGSRTGLPGTGLNAPRVFSRVQTGDQLVALTFDDGPAGTTGAVLDMLRDLQVPATFDVVGNRLQRHTDLVRRMGNDLHDIGNHTWSHRVLAGLTAAEIDPELRKTDELIQNITGDRPRYVRPPGGEVTPELLTVASEFGYDVLLWSVQLHVPALAATAGPGASPAPSDPVQYVLDNLQPGAIILAHDLGTLSGTGRGDPLRRLIAGAKAKGYRFLTVSQLVAAGTPLQGDAV